MIYNHLRIKALFVRAKGIEPIRLSAPDPKSGLSTNFNTPATVLFPFGKECKDTTFFQNSKPDYLFANPGRLFPYKENRHQRQCNYRHGSTYRKIYTEIDVIHHNKCNQKKPDSHGTGNQIVFPYVHALANNPAEVRNAKRDESDRTAYGYRTCYK